ncbi:MAG: TraR/DksA family transcriptional regulator [Alphaproteobacteria bacterium]|nr:TraR/DksA family transcriptional regulator [Alphaproteobacteria bacterium]
MTEIDLDAAKASLEAELERVLRRTGAVEAHLRGGDGRNEADFEDRVAYTELDDVLEQLDDAGRADAERIRAALRRVADGTYGQCAACGEDIQPRRLQAIPWTAFCVDHADQGEGA